MKEKNYSRTIAACFLGISNQAVITNITAVLFVHFMGLYGFELWQLGVLVGINFGVQMTADIILTFLIDRFHFRPLVLTATAVSTIGLVAYGALGFFAPAGHMFLAISLTTVVFAFSSGMCEVILSPIMDSIPETAASPGLAMSLMHSFYAWGQVVCIIVTALFLLAAGPEKWGLIVMLFALVPLTSFVLFAGAPMEKKQAVQTRDDVKKTLFSRFFLVALTAILLGGAAEIVMNQWVSTFLVQALGVEKTVADIFGMALFAGCIGLGRMLHGSFGDRWDLSKVLAGGSLVTFVLFLFVGLSGSPLLSLIAAVVSGLSVSLLWPGTLTLASHRFPAAGAWLFAVLAVFGDVGGTVIPLAAGFIAEGAGLSLMFVMMSAVPLGALFCHGYLMRDRG